MTPEEKIDQLTEALANVTAAAENMLLHSPMSEADRAQRSKVIAAARALIPEASAGSPDRATGWDAKLRQSLERMELFAWVGEDEHGSGEIGLKQALVPAGYIPLVATRREKVDRPGIHEQLRFQMLAYQKPIRLARFVFAGIVSKP